MPISNIHKIFFIHIPKNAGTSVSKSLEMNDIGHHLWTYYKNKYPNEWNTYKKIAIIRNPWDRMVSNYEYGKMPESYWHSMSGNPRYPKHVDLDVLKNITFKEAVNLLYKDRNTLKHQGWAPQHIYIVDQDDNIIVDHLIDYNNVEDSIEKITSVKIKKMNQSNRKNYKDYYDQELIDKVAEIYKKDIKLFNFKYE